ncbi:MAG: GIY-YIG nuclease family protein [Alphaproteobacteria bacterium]|nr:GIY-YIG nuclease family protein [Alphaproteobacteria bacterium]
MKEKKGYVYIMASQPGGTLYIGVTSDLPKRKYEHEQGSVEGFTKKYGCKTLVYYEIYDDMEHAIVREKQLKKWNRAWKLRLINEHNPAWGNLEI